MAENRLGGAWFELSVKDKNLVAGLVRAEQQAKESATNINASLKGVGANFSDVGDSSKKMGSDVEQSALQQVSAFRRLFSQVAGGIAVFGSFLAIGERIGRMLVSNAESTEAWFQSFQSRSAEDRLSSIGEELKKLQNANDGGIGGAVEALFMGMSPAQVREKIKALEDEREALSIVAAGRRAQREDEEIQRKYEKDLAAWQANEQKKASLSMAAAEQLLSLRLSLETDGLKKIQMETDAALERAERQFDSLGSDRIKQLQDAILADQERKTKEYNDRIEKDRIDSEKRIADKKLQMELDNIRRAEDYRRSISQGFGVGDVTTSDTTALRQAIETLAASQNYGNRD